MKRIFVHTLCFALTFAFGVSISLLFFQPSERDVSAPAVVEEVERTPPLAPPTSSLDSAIRRIDFANFTYPSHIAGVSAFKLQNGELLLERKDKIDTSLDVWLNLVDVTYGDVTGDGAQEAIIDLGWITGGSAITDLVYIYGLNHGKPRLLWTFETGDRADGGYQNVFAENGQLVVELKGRDKVIGRNLYEDDGTNSGACCPTFFTRTRYKWTNNHFQQQGNPEVLPITNWQR